MARRGEKLTPQAREVLAQAARGREFTEEHRRRIGEGVRRTASKRRLAGEAIVLALAAAAEGEVAQVDPRQSPPSSPEPAAAQPIRVRRGPRVR